ncbi:amidohydrolase family protein [Candidatus Deianiraea vastatrix]|uniref:Uncharacterized protein n=1 Tax=Candidatus Deianiraea vastatrix TaxID=2163644 RepID=A0A5B8XK11_9RICK|nr:hypothetical protein [Candidatus Deianiraea vastatrix]QED23837.1 hypothetical protein Deia_01055 [Candidatus Deianiraea vastatrix]
MPILSIIFTILFAIFTNTSLANPTQNPTEKTTIKAQKPKFHKPETEAERALDEILISSNISDGRYITVLDKYIENKANAQQMKINKMLLHGQLFTSNFLKSANIEKFDNYVQNLTCAIFESHAPPFLYHTYKNEKDKHYIIALKVYKDIDAETHDKNTLGMTDKYNIQYIVKYDEGKWKIDGIYCHNAKINFTKHDLNNAIVKHYEKFA